MVYVNGKFFHNSIFLYIVGKDLKNAIQWYYFRKHWLEQLPYHIFLNLLVHCPFLTCKTEEDYFNLYKNCLKILDSVTFL